MTHSKEWVINPGCTFYICCEKEKFAEVTLPNDERMKVKGIGEAVIMTHDDVKRKLGEVRYVLKLKRNLISLGRCQFKGCTFKARVF